MKRIIYYINDAILESQVNRALKEEFELIKSNLALSDYKLLENRYQPIAIIIESSILHESYNYLDTIIKDNNIVIVLNRQIETGPYYNYLSLPNFILLDMKRVDSLHELLPFAIKSNSIIITKNQKIQEYKEKLDEEIYVKKAKLLLMKGGMKEDEAYKYILDLAMKQRITKLKAAKNILSNIK